MSRKPWRRHRTADTPRPGGRRWSHGLRRGRSFARRVLAARERVRRVATMPTPNGSGERIEGLASRAPVVPVSPAPYGAAGSGHVVTAPPADGGPTPRPVPLLPGETTLVRRLKFGLVNACTIVSILLGLSAVFLAMQGDVRLGALVLMGCVLFDGLDGGLARRLGVASPFGAQMDSLADMCSFGLAAPLLAYFWLQGQAPLVVVAPMCVLVTVCAAVRLARFNVSPKDGQFFSGVPTTVAAAIMAATVLLNPQPEPVAVALATVGGLAVLMVSGFPYAKLPQIAKLPPWLWVLPVGGAFIDLSAAFAILVAAYLLSGPLLWMRHRRQGAPV